MTICMLIKHSLIPLPLWRYFLTPIPIWMDSWTQAASKAIRPPDGPGLFAFPAVYSFSEYKKTADCTCGQGQPSVSLWEKGRVGRHLWCSVSIAYAGGKQCGESPTLKMLQALSAWGNVRASGIPSCVPACRTHEYHPHLENLVIDVHLKWQFDSWLSHPCRAHRCLPLEIIVWGMWAPVSKWSLILKASWVTGIFSNQFTPQFLLGPMWHLCLCNLPKETLTLSIAVLRVLNPAWIAKRESAVHSPDNTECRSSVSNGYEELRTFQFLMWIGIVPFSHLKQALLTQVWECFIFLPLFALKGLYSDHRSTAPGCLFLKTPLPKTSLTCGNGCFTLHGAEQRVRTQPCSKGQKCPWMSPASPNGTTAVHFGTIVILIHRMRAFITLLKAHRTQCFRKARAGFQPPPYLRVLLLWRQHWATVSNTLPQPLCNH